MTHPDTRYRHGSGDDEAGCLACQFDAVLDGKPLEDTTGCADATPDGDEPELCKFCSHTVERLA